MGKKYFMMLRALIFGLLVLLSSHAAANDAELRRLQTILTTLDQQLSATYQQFQMVEQARRAVVQSLNAARPGLDPRSYDQMVKDRAQAAQQERSLTEQMNRLLAKAEEIENHRNPLLDRVYQLLPLSESTQPQATPSPTPPFNLPEARPASK